MTQRGGTVLLVAAVIAGVLGVVLFIGAAGARGDRPGEGGPRVFFGDRPPPAARTVQQIQERVPGPVRPLVPAQRQIAAASREAAGYLLTLLFVGSALVFARGPVVAAYRSTLGGWRAQLRVLALGGAVLAVMTSAVVLLFFAMLGTVAGPGGPVGRGGLAGPGALLQVGVTVVGVTIVLAGLVALVGVAATAWRLGDGILARLAPGAPPTLVALLGASLLYLAAQIPVAGSFFGVIALAYALGTVAVARLAPRPQASPVSPPPPGG